MEHKERIYFWDNYKGVLIFLVVFGHFLLETNHPTIHIIVDIIYMFHMPAFVFISGLFGKSEHSFSSDSILKLLAAFFLFNGLSSIIFNEYSFFVPFAIYWYILALIAWRIFTPRMANNRVCLMILIIISILIGYSNEVTVILAASRIISFAPFYIAGYLLSMNVVHNRLIHKSPRNIIVGILSVELAFLIGFFSYNTFRFIRGITGITREELFMWPYPIPDLSSGIGRACIMLTAALAIYGLGTFIPNKRIPLVSRFGRNSLSIYLFHIFYLWFCKYVYISNEYLYLLLAFLLSIATCILLSMPFIARFTDKLLTTGANLFKGNKETGYFPLVVRTLFCGIGVLFLLHQPILRIIDYVISLSE